MSLTRLIRPVFTPRMRELERHIGEGEALQRETLARLLADGRKTSWGHAHGLDSVHTYEQFAAAMPLGTYEEHKAMIDRMRHGERDLLCPGRVRWYAKSSGTTNDTSKFLPVSARGLKDTHYRGGADVVIMYLRDHPESRLFDGRALILGGSHAPNYNLKGSLVGDLSAILIENINPLVNLLRVPKKETALISDFEVKRDRIAREAMHKSVTNISGVPSWMLSVLSRMMEITGKTHLEEVWPDIEVFFHGGVAFTPYREQYRRLITSPRMSYMETYNASEGFFGIQSDPADPSMLLMLDYGVFYEFIPMDKFDEVMADVADSKVQKPNSSKTQHVVPLWGVQMGVNYAMVITTSSGLWRYVIGDTVRFTSTHPYKFVITGRTKSFINAFGEELIVDNAERGLHAACLATGAQVAEYTAAPIFMDDKGKCRHQWLVEFSVMPDDTERFARVLDETLRQLNSDYDAKRYHDVTLQPLQLVVARPGLFNEWMKSRGKLGGQHKVPRLSNSRRYIDELMTPPQPSPQGRGLDGHSSNMNK